MSSTNQIFYLRSRLATDSTSSDYQACTRDTLWCQRYVTTSKEYLINCHISLQYFELVFLQLQLVKFSCKLISIWVNYEKNKRGPFLWNTVFVQELLQICNPIDILYLWIYFSYYFAARQLEKNWLSYCFYTSKSVFFVVFFILRSVLLFWNVFSGCGRAHVIEKLQMFASCKDGIVSELQVIFKLTSIFFCLLYTSDAADE